MKDQRPTKFDVVVMNADAVTVLIRKPDSGVSAVVSRKELFDLTRALEAAEETMDKMIIRPNGQPPQAAHA